jgi:hypothetical protein
MANVIAYGFTNTGNIIGNYTEPQAIASLLPAAISQDLSNETNNIGRFDEPTRTDPVFPAALMDPLPSSGGAGGPHSYANII